MLTDLNQASTIIIVGRAHSGTRVLPESLQMAGVYMGEHLNVASDLLPVTHIYAACRIFGKYVQNTAPYQWDFQQAVERPIPEVFVQELSQYLQPLMESKASKKGWKIPENNLIYPWLTRLLPEATFVYWVRHPEGSCARMTGMDRLEKWNVPAKRFWIHEWNYKLRVQSWKYLYDIVKQTPIPKRFIQIKFEDYVLQHDDLRPQLETYLDVPLVPRELDSSKVGPYHKKLGKRYPFLKEAMDQLGYQ